MILPRKVGVFTVVRLQDTDDVSESFVAILDEPAARRVLARRITGEAARSPRAIAALRDRVAELRAVRHPSLARAFDVVEAEGEVYVLEAWSDGVPLSEVLRFCLLQQQAIPVELFLYLATQLCNAIEELHGRPAPGPGPARGHILHLALCPAAVQVTVDGRITLGRYGLFREGPMAGAHGVEYLAPEQTRPGVPGPKLLPATDVFALGAVLYELLTRKPLFRTDHIGRTLERIRSADINTELVEVRELMPGLEKVMFRALSANPQHRYQRAFVLREDLRGLMVGYSFGDIATVARSFLGPIARAAYEWYVSGAHPAPARPTSLLDSQATAETVAAVAPAGSSAGPPSLGEPDTQWFAQGPSGVLAPLRRRPIERLPDTTRVPLACPLPALTTSEDHTERNFLPRPPLDERDTARLVLPILPFVSSRAVPEEPAVVGLAEPATLTLELDDTEGSTEALDDPRETERLELPFLARSTEEAEPDLEDWTDRLPPAGVYDAPLPVSVASAAADHSEEGCRTETLRLGPAEIESMSIESRSMESSEAAPHMGADPIGPPPEPALRVRDSPPAGRIRIDDVPMPAPLDVLPARAATPAPAEETDPELPWSTARPDEHGWLGEAVTVAPSRPAAAWSPSWAQPQARPRGPSRRPVGPLAVVAFVTAMLCVLLCLGPPAGVLWASAVNGTYPNEIMWWPAPAEAVAPAASGSTEPTADPPT
jgi:eukaryotic-like serine/threonine-protein kinase